jgi:hypothetical protein
MPGQVADEIDSLARDRGRQMQAGEEEVLIGIDPSSGGEENLFHESQTPLSCVRGVFGEH